MEYTQIMLMTMFFTFVTFCYLLCYIFRFRKLPGRAPGWESVPKANTDRVYTPGTARGAKLAALLVDEGTALIRKIFEHEVQDMNPPSLREQLKNYRGCLYDGHKACDKKDKKHKKHFKLYDEQKKTLYPDSGVSPDNTQGFDITLLECLMKELVWLELGRDPQKSEERDRLRRFRNANYGRRPRTDLSEEDFNRLWKELTGILVALGGDEDKISDRLNSSIDPKLAAEYFALLDRLYKEDMEVKHFLSHLKKGQGGLKERQFSIKDCIKEGHDNIKEGQADMKTLFLEQVRDNQSPGTSTRPRAESSCQTDQVHAGPPDVVDDVIACLKVLYATKYGYLQPLPWCDDLNLYPGEDYINLQLQQRDDRGRFRSTGSIVSISDIYNTTKAEGSQGNVRSAIRKIRVEGDPGIGKSHSCQKLAYDWSRGNLDRFKAVFFLEMRHLAGKIKDEIFELLPKDTNTTRDQLWSYIQENQDDVLFILDGLDELSQAAREVTDVVDLIQGKILRYCHVLVTSRPYHCVKDLENCHQFYKIVGFTKENSDAFIHKYFCESPESASKLMEQLHRNRLSEIVVHPLNNMIICVVWKENGKLPSSTAGLYEMIVSLHAMAYCTRIDLPMEGDKLPPDIEEALRDLGKLSWEGLEQEQLQFNMDEIKRKYQKNADNMLNMGLLVRFDSFSSIKRTCYCTFWHKMFQEYMAARYISGLVMDRSSREEGMKCVCRLFGLSDDTVVNRELVISCCHKYREVKNRLFFILGENSRPLFERFAEELSKAQTDEDRNLLSFFCIMWLGTSSAGDKMAEIVAPRLSHHATNYPVGVKVYDHDHKNWCVGLAHVLAFQKKLSVGHGASFIQHLTIHCDRIDGVQQEKLGALENALSDFGAMRSVTLVDTIADTTLRTFIPLCGTERVVIRINNYAISLLSLLDMLEQFSAVSVKDLLTYLIRSPHRRGESPASRFLGPCLSTIEHVEITACAVFCDPGERDVDFSEYDRLLARIFASHSRLRSFKFAIGSWERNDSQARGFGNLTATLQSISEHARLEVVEFELPGKDNLDIEDDEFPEVGLVNNGLMPTGVFVQDETFNAEPMVHTLTECVKKNKVLKTLRLRWRTSFSKGNMNKIYQGECSDESLSSLCSAIRENQTLESLVVEGMLSHTECRAEMISELIRTKPSNYKELSITLSVRTSPHDQA